MPERGQLRLVEPEHRPMGSQIVLSRGMSGLAADQHLWLLGIHNAANDRLFVARNLRARFVVEFHWSLPPLNSHRTWAEKAPPNDGYRKFSTRRVTGLTLPQARGGPKS